MMKDQPKKMLRFARLTIFSLPDPQYLFHHDRHIFGSAPEMCLLFTRMGFDQCFSRTIVMKTFILTPSPAKVLIKKMPDSGLIVPISGHGKENISNLINS